MNLSKKKSPKPIANIYYTLSPDYTEKEAFLDFEKFQTAFIEAIDTYGANNIKAEVLSDSVELNQFVYITELGSETNKLIEAVYEKDIDKIRIALENGADIHARDDWALGYAAEWGTIEMTKLFLENGADIHARNDGALRWAAESGRLEVIKLLLENGADIHACNDAALGYAAEFGYLEVAKFLLENGANIHACDDMALGYAAEWGHLEITKLLLENGADIHARDDESLRLAAERGRLEVIKLLLENGANPYKIDESHLREVKPNNCTDILALLQQYKDKSVEKPIAKIRYIVSPTFTDEMLFVNPEKFKSEFIQAIDTYGVNNIKAEVLSDSVELKQFVERTVIDEFGLEPDEPAPSIAPEIIHTEQTPIENKSQPKSPSKRSIREMLKAAKEKCSIINAAKAAPEKSSRDINITR